MIKRRDGNNHRQTTEKTIVGGGRKVDDDKKEDTTECKEEETAAGSSTTDEERKRISNKAKKEYFNKKYCYGNFDRYYGSRLNPGAEDSRLSVLRREWFEHKAVLDVGCNVGFLTLSIAKEYSPRRILGIDIDEHLVGVARKNIRHYCDEGVQLTGNFPASFACNTDEQGQAAISFSTKFPDNVWFRTENYVLEVDEMLDMVEEEYDVILVLSITKWIHLNWGDDGMRRFFKRAFRHLLPGGRLIIEPQPFSTYRKRAKMSDDHTANFKAITFKPEHFEGFLLKECGFQSVDHLGAPEAKSKGFARPIDVYTKAPPEFMQRRQKKKTKAAERSSQVERTETENGEGTGQHSGRQGDNVQDTPNNEGNK